MATQRPTREQRAAQLAEAEERVAGLAAQFESHLGQGETALVAPGCSLGCQRCVRECAVLTIHLRLWRERLAKLRAEAGLAVNHAGMIYAEPMGSA